MQERVEQSVAMDSSGMRKRVCLERCDAGLEKLIREVSENGPSPLQSRRVASQACSAVRVKAKLAEYHQHQYMARLEVKAKRAEYDKQYMARPGMKAKRAEYNKRYMARPEVRAKMAKYYARPEVKAKKACLLYTSPSPRDGLLSRMPSSA